MVGAAFLGSRPRLSGQVARFWSRPVLVRLTVLTLVSAGMLFGLFALYRQVEWRSDLEVHRLDQEARLAAVEQRLGGEFAKLASDIALIAADPWLGLTISSRHPEMIERMAAHYATMMAHSGAYAEVRVTDGAGRQVVRVAASGGAIDDTDAPAPAAGTPATALPVGGPAVRPEPAARAVFAPGDPTAVPQPRVAMTATVPVHDDGGAVAGALSIHLDTERVLASLAASLAFDGQAGRLEVTGGDGHRLYPLGGTAPALVQGTTRPAGSSVADGVLVSHRHLPIGDWIAAAEGAASAIRLDGAGPGDWLVTVSRPVGTWLGFQSDQARVVTLIIAGLSLAALILANSYVSVRLADRQIFLNRLTNRDRQFRDLEANVRGVIFRSVRTADGDLEFRYVSPRIRDIYGIEAADYLRNPRLLTIHPGDRGRWRRSLQISARHLTDWDFEGRFVLSDGSVRWWRGVARPVAGPDALTFNGIIIDIDESKRRERDLVVANQVIQHQAEALKQLSETDELTGAVNRRLLMARLDGEVARARRYRRPLSLAILDIDHFKAINDRLGHDVGDAALAAVVETCQAAVREQDTVARIGGEEFAVLLPETAIEPALATVERVRLAIQCRLIARPAASFAVTCSVGLAELGEDDSVADLIRRADQALYQAKRTGRNRTVTALKGEVAPPAPADGTALAEAAVLN